MLTLKEIAEAKMALAEGVLLPSVWTARAFDAAEAWAKLVVVVEKMDWVELSMRESAVVALANNRLGGDLDALEHVGEAATPEAAVEALFDKIGGTDAKCD